MRVNFRVVFAAILLVAGCQRHEGAPKGLLASGEKLYSQFNEELIIRHFFDDRKGGFFVDVGSWHFRDGSTTYYLEKHLGWSGIAIDAQEHLRKGYDENRPNTRFFSYAVGDKSGEKVTFYLAGQLSSTHEDHLRFFDKAKDYKPQAVEVETITLNDLLTRQGVDRIDFLSMDIEEAEPAALAGFDIAKYRPALVCIEAAEVVREPIATYFVTHGYERIDEYLKHDEVNWYFRPRRR